MPVPVMCYRVSGMATWYGTVSKRCIKAGRAANGKNKDTRLTAKIKTK